MYVPAVHNAIYLIGMWLACAGLIEAHAWWLRRRAEPLQRPKAIG